MFKAVKTRIAEYVSPIFDKRRFETNDISTPSEQSIGCKRHFSGVGQPEPASKRKRVENTLRSISSSSMNIFGSISRKLLGVSDENDATVDVSVSTEAAASRPVLTATRRRETIRHPLTQLSDTTILDSTNLDSEDDFSCDLQITKVSEDLTKSFKVRNSHSFHSTLLDNTQLANVVIDSTEAPKNLVGPLARQKSTGLLDETFRLDEKMRYKTLLAHFTNVNLPEYSQSIIPGSSAGDISSSFDHVTNLSSSSWFGRKYSARKPIFVDLTRDEPVTTAVQLRQSSPRRKFFFELLSKPKGPFPSKLEASQASPKEYPVVARKISETANLSTSCSALYDTDWIQKLREVIDPIKLERERQISEEEARREAIKRKQKEIFEEKQKKEEEKAKVSEFIELTDVMLKTIKKALAPGNPSDVFVEGFNAEITRGDIASLRHSTWLNDEVVNFYFNLLKERSEKDTNLPKVHVFNTFFYPKIMKVGHAGVKRWTRKIDVFSFDLILIPVHLGMHWCLAVVDFKGKQIAYYDSLKGNNPQCIFALKKYLSDESKDKKKCEFVFDGWEEVMPKQIPEQMNGCDCGVFMCKYAEYRSRGVKFTFTQSHMPYFRNRMIYEIISKNLL